MEPRHLGYAALAAVGVLAILAGAFVLDGPIPVGTGEYERATVSVVDENGTVLGTVDVRVADTHRQRYTGLSDTRSMAPDEGMLFVFGGEARRPFVMREMDFPLDIVFVGANHTITRIHHAPVPANTNSSRLRSYRGTGRFVLEVSRGWTTRHGVSVGDRIRIRGYQVRTAS